MFPLSAEELTLVLRPGLHRRCLQNLISLCPVCKDGAAGDHSGKMSRINTLGARRLTTTRRFRLTPESGHTRTMSAGPREDGSCPRLYLPQISDTSVQSFMGANVVVSTESAPLPPTHFKA